MLRGMVGIISFPLPRHGMKLELQTSENSTDRKSNGPSPAMAI